MTDFRYVGAELELFATAQKWKSYWSRRLKPLVVGDVLEVGAGIGSNTRIMDPGGQGRWVCLEPDSQLAAQLTKNLAQAKKLRDYEVVSGTLKSLDPSQKFDTIIYIDVLEHIENDREELETAASLLRAGGRIVVLAPAHQRLYAPFDSAIGHFRRYNRRMLQEISPSGLNLEQLFYLDSAGLVSSMVNLFLLRQSMPNRIQLRIWDRLFVPVSCVLDKCLFNAVGKSIIAVWRLDSGDL